MPRQRKRPSARGLPRPPRRSSAMPGRRRRGAGLGSRRGPGRTISRLGRPSFLAAVAGDMVMPLLPAFIVTLGGGAASIGTIEGAAEATASLFKYLSGRWADRARRLRPLAVL